MQISQRCIMLILYIGKYCVYSLNNVTMIRFWDQKVKGQGHNRQRHNRQVDGSPTSSI